MNVQNEVFANILHFGATELAAYKIQLLLDSEIKKVQKEYEEKIRWIPIEEKFPENNKIVEAKLKKDGNPIFFFYKPENKKWYLSKIVLGEVEFLLTDLVPVEWRYFL